MRLIIQQAAAGGGSGSSLIRTETYKPNVTNDGSEFNAIASNIVVVIRRAGIIIGVISLMIIGFKAIVGSAEDKAEYKKVLPGYIVGIVLVMAITLIPTFIYEITKDL